MPYDAEYHKRYYKTEKGKEAVNRAIRKYMKTEKGRATLRKQQLKPHIEALKFLGGKCVKCGFSDVRALQIDHISGGGNKEYKKHGGMYGVYKNVLLEPEKYQLLCANCNWIKRFENKEVRKWSDKEANEGEAK